MYNSKGTKAYTHFESDDPWKRQPPRMMPEKGGPVDKLWTLYDQTKVEPDQMKRTQLVWDMIKVHVSDVPFFQGTVANPPQVEEEEHQERPDQGQPRSRRVRESVDPPDARGL
jgi:peptide/nickel transport system substrate-binding protein